jgi:hypothetical protein
VFNTEWFDVVFGALAFISAALSVHQWRRAAVVPFYPDHPDLARSWQSTRRARAGSAAAFALLFSGLLLISEVIEALTVN